MKVLISGASGLIGSRVVVQLTKDGHDIVRLVRSRNRAVAGTVYWSPAKGEINAAACDGVDAVVHLAGKGIASGRWNARVKREIRDSRIKGTRLLCETLAGCERPPRTLVMASAIGYYGDREGEVLREDAPPGDSFLADVCKEWEAEAQPAIDAGVRVVPLRIGMVLTPRGGALKRLLPQFKFGLGGLFGSGTQYWSWVTLEDLVNIVEYCLKTEAIHGPVNAVAPHPVTNLQFTSALGSVLDKPAGLVFGRKFMRFFAGEMADALMLASIRAVPSKLQQHGFQFSHPDIDTALLSMLAK